jgi:hypothetical protein
MCTVSICVTVLSPGSCATGTARPRCYLILQYSRHAYYQHLTLNNISIPLTFESHILHNLLVPGDPGRVGTLSYVVIVEATRLGQARHTQLRSYYGNHCGIVEC